MSPNLELNPFRSLPYITVQLPSAIVSNVINKRASKEASWPSLFHMYTRDLSLPTSSSSSSFNFRRLPSCTSNQLLPSNAIAAAAANGCHPTDTKTSATPAFSAASCEYLCYSSVVTVVERLYFLSLPHASEWVEDEEQHTDWAVSSFFLSHAPGLSPMSVPAPLTDTVSMASKSYHPNATGALNISEAHLHTAEVGPMSEKEFSMRTSSNSFSDIGFPVEKSEASISTRTPVYPLSLTLPRDYERSDSLSNSSLYFNRRNEEISNPRLNRDSNRDYTNSEGSMTTTRTVSPAKCPNPVSALSQSLRLNKTKSNQFPSPVPSSSPLVSTYGKTLGVTSLGPALSPSPSWRLKERDRGVRPGTGGISGLIRMQSMGATMGSGIIGQSHTHGHVGVGHNNNSQSTSHLLGHLNPSPIGGGVDVRAMIGEAKRRSDQRLNTDHQYLHRMAYACVRVGPNGFVWLSNNTGKVSDLNLSAERENLNLKKQNEFRSFCTSVSICYEIILDVVEHSLQLAAERNVDESTNSSTNLSNGSIICRLDEESVVRKFKESAKKDQVQINTILEGDIMQIDTHISTLPRASISTIPIISTNVAGNYIWDGKGAVADAREGQSHGELYELKSRGQVMHGNHGLDSDPDHVLMSQLQSCDMFDGGNIGAARNDENENKDGDQFESYNYSNSCSPSPLTPETSIMEIPSP